MLDSAVSAIVKCLFWSLAYSTPVSVGEWYRKARRRLEHYSSLWADVIVG